MPSRSDVHYFGAGPAPLPTPILEEASNILLNYKDTGIGIAEISHRSADATAILENAKSSLRKLLDIPSGDDATGYEVLFLHGGGSGEFSAVVYHMVSRWVGEQWAEISANGGTEDDLRARVKSDLRLDYIVTGSWSLKASQEAARLIGAEHINIVADARQSSSDGKKFGAIPQQSSWKPSSSPALTYYCDNETVDGVEFPFTPTGKNLVGDMSSNFISRKVDVKAHAAIFGGAQKNIGTTGITLAIVSNSLLPPAAKMAEPALLRRLGLPVGPIVLDWPTIAKNNSLYNTIPIFDVWVAGAVMQRLITMHGGIEGQEREANAKAEALYAALDSKPEVYQVVPSKEARSRMNVCFRVKGGDAEAEKAFLKGAEAQGLTGIKGHRSVGGMRISNYNAVPVEAVEKLTRYLGEFAS